MLCETPQNDWAMHVSRHEHIHSVAFQGSIQRGCALATKFSARSVKIRKFRVSWAQRLTYSKAFPCVSALETRFCSDSGSKSLAGTMGKRTDEKQSKRGKVEKKEKVKDKKPTKNDLAKTDKKDRPNPKKAEEKKAAVKVSKDKSQKKSASSKVPKEEQKKAAAKTDKKDLAVPEKKHDKDGGSKKVKKATPVQPVEKHEKKRKDKAECKNSKPPVLAIRDAPSRRCTTKTRPETEPDTSFMTPPEHVRRMSSPSLSQASDTSLAKYEREAEKANMNLEDYLQKVSSEELEKAVEARMKEIVETSDGQEKEGKEKEEQKDEDKEEEKEEEKSSSASSSDAEVSDASDDEEDVSASLGKEHEGIDEGLDGEPLSDDEGEEKSEAELDSDEEASEDGIDEAEVEQQVQALVPIEKDVQQQDPAGKNSANANALTQAVATQRAAGESRNVDISKANSSNCKAEWDKFSRQCLDRRRFPVALAGHYQKDKLDLFRSWLSAKEDWSKVEVEIQRKAERTNKATKKRAGMKAREIMKAYPQKKALDLINRLRTNGLWAYDEDFDQDEEEIFYFNSGSTFKCEDATSESMAIKASETGNKDLIESLTGEGGPLQAGLLPAAPVKNEKALHDAFGDATKAVKTPKPKKGDSTEKAEPKTFEQIVTEKMEACLKKGGEGRRHAISLEAVEYSGDLAKKLMAFSAKMEKVYKKLQELCSQKSKDPKEYQKLIDIIDEKLAWFEKAEAAAKSLQSGMNPRPKKKAKTRQSGKAEKDTTDAAADGNSAITP